MLWPAVSPARHRVPMERTSGPVRRLIESLRSEPAKFAQLRSEVDAVAVRYFEPERNVVRFDNLMTRAVKN